MYGDIKITLVKTETLAEYVVRTFALERVSLPTLFPQPREQEGRGAAPGRKRVVPAFWENGGRMGRQPSLRVAPGGV